MTELELKPEHAADPSTRTVGILVGVVGIFLSVVTIASHRAHTDAVIHRTESNDSWTYYQAKKIRENTTDMTVVVLQTLAADPAKIDAPLKKLEQASEKYKTDAEEIRKTAEAKDEETHKEEARALRFDIGEGLLELGLVLCSLYFLARKAFFPVIGMIASVAGTAMGIWGRAALKATRAAERAAVCVRLLIGAAAVAVLTLRVAAADPAASAPRVEARSSDLLAVGVVHGERMVVRLSSLADNAPVSDASVTVQLRGTVHPTTAEADGSYTWESKDLSLPGSASVQFRIARGEAVEELKGTLAASEAEKAGDKGAARQGWWWVLNFGVCIGFLWLLSRRRKTAAT